ncbi:hypothetical protein [Streptomyces sp. SID3343]|uniref:hypothetical protein n=1 Tax=Streptomyces sp. SID3343 TaxID=2690260 RepID=UPI00136ACC76|nr:hypothetical protein [Streptomyces sp. SID3343]MYW04651.1 hypothetical protein [Streptomyces sp. SID3343]
MSDSTAPTGIELVRPPEVLLAHDEVQVFHGGILRTPAGLYTTIGMRTLARPSGPRPPAPPLFGQYGVSVTRSGDRFAYSALASTLSAGAIRFTSCLFGHVPDGDLVLDVVLPTIPRRLVLRFDSDRHDGADLALVAPPAILRSANGVTLWHAGVLRTEVGLVTHLEATSSDDRALGGAKWDVEHAPLTVTWSDPAPPREAPQRGRDFVSVDSYHAAPAAGVSLACPPLDVAVDVIGRG